jgi:poly(A) polymerase
MEQSLFLQDDQPYGITPLIIPRSDHRISRKNIDEEALKVLYRLHRQGFLAYLVGGGVRDLLLGKTPKDFDIATNAHPHEIKNLFRNSRIIGSRFRLVQVFFHGGKIVEVSTFRSRSEYEEVQNEEGKTIRTESFGTPDEDALRRDITINGLFYNIEDFSIIDYVGGMSDLKRKIIRTVGNPNERFQQDPVRMIRVLRHAARTGFGIEDQTYQAILRHREEIRKCSPSRVRDEFIRELKEGSAQSSLDLMLQTGLLFSIFPDLSRVLGARNPYRKRDSRLFLNLLGLADQLMKIGRPVPDSTLLALFLSPYVWAVTSEHPFLREQDQYGYRVQTTRWAVHQLLDTFSFPKEMKEIATQILIAQATIKRALQKGVIPKRVRLKRYFQEAVLFYGIEAHAKGREMPFLLRQVIPSDLLPWLPKGVQDIRKKRHRPPRRRHTK